MIAQAQAELPNECCGLLAGTFGTDGTARAHHRYPLVNALASPSEYFAEAKGMLAAHRDMRANGWELLAVYHSHPTSAPFPSRKDRERYEEVRPVLGEVIHVIISLAEPSPDVRLWWLTEDESLPALYELC